MTTTPNGTGNAPADIAAKEKQHPPEEQKRLRQETEQYQIELEMQNEELRRAQEELQALKNRYFDLYDLAPVGYLDVAENGLILEANLTAAGLLGVTKKQLVNRPLSRHLLPASTDDYYRHRQRLFASGEAQTCELQMLRGDGGMFWAGLHTSLSTNPDGQTHCRATLSDITDRKQAEEESLRSQARVRAIVNAANSGIITIDQQGVITSFNPSAVRLFGYAEDEAIGRNVNMLMPPPHRERHPDYLKAYLRTGAAKIIGVGREVLALRKDGSTFPAHIEIGEYQEKGERFFTGIVHDISAQIQADEERRRIQMLIEHSGDFIAMADLEGNITYMNAAGRRMIGLSEGEDPRRLHITHYTAPDSLDLLQSVVLPALLKGQGHWEGEMRLRNLTTGEVVEVNRSIFLVRDGSGSPIGLATVTRDITQRKRTEAALRESEAFASAVMNSVSAEIAVLDHEGTIIAVNEPWRRFTRQNQAGADVLATKTAIGANYLETCRNSSDGSAGAMAAHGGIVAVLEGRAPSFTLEYACPSPEEMRWFNMVVTPLEAWGGAVVSHSDITLRKRAEEALELQKHLLEMIVSGSPLALTLDTLLREVERMAPGMTTSILLLDADGVHLRHSAAPSLPEAYARAVDGLAVGEGNGSCGTAAFRHEPVVACDIASDPLWANYRELAAAFGLRACWAHPILDAAGQVLGTFAIYYPYPARPTPHHCELINLVVHIAALAITRHVEEQALRASEERLAFALDASGEGVWDCDIQEGRALHNRKWFELLGLDPANTPDSPKFFRTLLHPDDREAVLARIQQALDGDGKYQSEHRLRRTDGTYVWVQEHGAVVKRDEAGRGLRMVGSFADISQRKQAEWALRDSEERLSLVMEAAEIGFWDWDLRSGQLTLSPRCLALFGLPPDVPLSYQRFLQALHPDDRENIDQSVHDALENHLDYQVEMRTLWPDGSLHWVASRGRGYYDALGRPVRMSGAALDLTEHKRIERQLRERQAESELYTRLTVANQTIAAIAHELNQPLNAIASYSAGALRLLEADEPPKAKLVHALEQNNRQALRAGQVIRELLAFLRGKETAAEPLDLNATVQEVWEDIKMDGLFAGVKVVQNLAPGLPMVQANRAQVEKVLINLLRNGVEAMHEAGLPAKAVWITLRTGANGGFAQVSIRDSGPGLTPGAAKRIFEPFFTTKPRGLGMGLAISRTLIEANGGRLWVDQEEGPGTCFHFTLPFAVDVEKHAPSRPPGWAAPI